MCTLIFRSNIQTLLYADVSSVVAMILKKNRQFYHFYVIFYIFLLYYKKFRHVIRHIEPKDAIFYMLWRNLYGFQT